MTRHLLISSLVVGLVALSGCVAQPDPISPEGGEVSGGSETTTPQDVLQLEVGTCLMDLSTPLGQDLTEIPSIACSEPHESEVFAEVTLEGDTFPGVDSITETAIGACLGEFADFVGLDHAASILDFAYYYPTPSSWAVGDRSVFCVVFEPGVLTTGTLEQAKR